MFLWSFCEWLFIYSLDFPSTGENVLVNLRLIVEGVRASPYGVYPLDEAFDSSYFCYFEEYETRTSFLFPLDIIFEETRFDLKG